MAATDSGYIPCSGALSSRTVGTAPLGWTRETVEAPETETEVAPGLHVWRKEGRQDSNTFLETHAERAWGRIPTIHSTHIPVWDRGILVN